jgi:hypothetical protein
MAIVELEYNVDEIKSEFEAIPGGKYLAHLESIAQDLSKSSGKPKLVAVWIVDEGEFVGRKFWDHVPLSVGWRVKPYAEVAGISSGKVLDLALLVNAQAIITLNQIPSNQNPDEIVNSITKIEKAA